MTDGRKRAAQERHRLLLEKLGSEEAVKEHYRAMQAKSRINYKGNGGFRAQTKKRRQEIARLGGKASGEVRKSRVQAESGQLAE